MNKKKVILGLFILLMVWAGNIYYYHRYQLAEPMFMKHYYQFDAESERVLWLYSLGNIDDGLDVNFIEFPGIEGLQVTGWHNGGMFSHQTIKVFRVDVNEKLLAQEIKGEELIITNVMAMLSNGERKQLDIGEIRFYKSPVKRSERLIFQEKAAGGSNANQDFRLYHTYEPLKITKIGFGDNKEILNKFNVFVNNNQEVLKDFVDEYGHPQEGIGIHERIFEVEGTTLEKMSFPIEMDAQETLLIRSELKQVGENIGEQYDFISTEWPIVYETLDGHTYSYPMFIDYQTNFDENSIRKILNARRDRK